MLLTCEGAMQHDLDKLVQGLFPDFTEFDASYLLSYVEHALEQNAKNIQHILAQENEPTWDNFVAPLSDVDVAFSKVWSMASHLHSVRCTDDLREAYEASLPLVSAYYSKLANNTELYNRYEQLAQSDDFDRLDTAQKKIIENALRDFRLSGVALADADKNTLQSYQKQLAELTMQFGQNVMDATDSFKHHVTQEQDLSGLPELVLQHAKSRAETEGVAGWLFGLDAPTCMAILTYADNRALREVFYRAYTTRASDVFHGGEWDNSDVMARIQQVKQKMAILLGFNHYADLSLETKMAPNVASVIDFLDDLATKAKPQAQVEYAELKAFAFETDAIELAPWDSGYYSEKRKQQLYAFSSEAYRVYFPFQQVMDGLFEVVARVFGLNIIVEADVPVWHNDVLCYSVHDKKGGLRGYFYLDLYARPKKRGGAWMDNYSSRSKQANGTVESPIAYLNCNFAPPVGDTPALLTHDEVVTIFHEFGHTLHHILTQVDYSDVAGINGVMWDAVEFPSQFLEHWCYTDEGLAILAKHYETQTALPQAMQTQLLQSRHFQGAMQMMRQLEFAIFDMRIYSNPNCGSAADIQACLDTVRAEYAVTQALPENRFQHSFSHIFAGGYAAGYYSYKWAEVMSSDAFTQFEDQGVFNTELGEKYMQCVLEQGGVYDADVLFERFMGRPPQVDALLRHNGIDVT